MHLAAEDDDGGAKQCGAAGTICLAHDPLVGGANRNPAFGMISFDNFGAAMMTVFVACTLEGWSDVMYYVQVRCQPRLSTALGNAVSIVRHMCLLVNAYVCVQDGVSPWAAIFFILLVLFGAVVIVNLFLAVISNVTAHGKYADSMAEEVESTRFNANARACVDLLVTVRCRADYLHTFAKDVGM